MHGVHFDRPVFVIPFQDIIHEGKQAREETTTATAVTGYTSSVATMSSADSGNNIATSWAARDDAGTLNTSGVSTQSGQLDSTEEQKPKMPTILAFFDSTTESHLRRGLAMYSVSQPSLLVSHEDSPNTDE